MIPSERRDYIYRYVHEYQLASISALSELMSVSHMTVRRDIRVLEEQGKVVSVSGGVRLSEALRGAGLLREGAAAPSPQARDRQIRRRLGGRRPWSIWTPAPPPSRSPAARRSASI